MLNSTVPTPETALFGFSAGTAKLASIANTSLSGNEKRTCASHTRFSSSYQCGFTSGVPTRYLTIKPLHGARTPAKLVRGGGKPPLLVTTRSETVVVRLPDLNAAA